MDDETPTRILSPETTVAPPATSGDVPISKNAMKKMAKAARWEVKKKEKRALEKIRRKENKRKRIEAGEVMPPKKRKLGEWNGSWIVLDLGFDDKMSDKEVVSLTGQLSYCYNHARNCQRPSRFLCTGLNGRTEERLKVTLKAQHENWDGFKWTSEPLQSLCSSNDEETQVGDSPNIKFTSIPKFKVEDIVYLTADSPNIITTLDAGKAYVIGALVDHNRYKALSLNKANDLKISHAQLPIGQYLPQLTTRKVLTVNQVVDIMLKWFDSRDWEKALEEVIPKRKFDKQENVTVEEEAEDASVEASLEVEGDDVDVGEATTSS